MADSGRIREDVWTCEACGTPRPDEAIEVASEAVYIGRVEWRRNVKHCRDREGCGRVAQAILDEWRSDPWPPPRPIGLREFERAFGSPADAIDIERDVREAIRAGAPGVHHDYFGDWPPIDEPYAFEVDRYGGIFSIEFGPPPWWRPLRRLWYWMRGHDVMRDSRPPAIGTALADVTEGGIAQVAIGGVAEELDRLYGELPQNWRSE